jgi:hypothetical protein
MQLGLYLDDVLVRTYRSREEFEQIHDLSLKNRSTGLLEQAFNDGELAGHVLRSTSGIDLSGEEWRPLVYPDTPVRDGYQVSSLGRIKLIRRKTYGFATSDGYKAVALQSSTSSTFSPALVHRLVAYTFLGAPDNAKSLVVNHLDGDKTNNTVANLEWATYSQNTRHSSNVINKHVLRSVASYDQRSGELIKAYPSIKSAADDVGKTASAVQEGVRSRGLIADRFWIYVDGTPLERIDLKTMKKTNKQRVAQYDQRTGAIVDVHDSFTSAAERTQMNMFTLITAASKKKSACGFIWVKVPHGDVPQAIDPSDFTIAGKYDRRRFKRK